MVQLCSNRPEGFSASSRLSSPLPTTCFTDVILIPLPVWIYLLLLALFIALSFYQHKANYNPSTSHLRSTRRSSTLHKICLIVYYLLIIANILMMTLEIVRLCLIHFGIGLLPFSYVALVLGGLLHMTDGGVGRARLGRPYWVAANTFVWVGLMVMSIVQTVGLVYLEGNGVTLKGSKYPVSDQVIDVAVMAGVYLVIAGLEVALALGKRERDVSPLNSVDERYRTDDIGLAK